MIICLLNYLIEKCSNESYINDLSKLTKSLIKTEIGKQYLLEQDGNNKQNIEKLIEKCTKGDIASLAEFINSEFAIKVKFDRIDYRLVFGGIENIEDGIYIKDRLDEVTPVTKRKFYKRIIQVATTNDELNIIRKNILV